MARCQAQLRRALEMRRQIARESVGADPKSSPATMNDEGVADAAAANPLRTEQGDESASHACHFSFFEGRN